MKSSGKVIVTIVVVVVIAVGGIYCQRSSSTPKVPKLSKQDMEIVFRELLPPQRQQEIAGSPEEKKKLVEDVKQLLALAYKAEQEGYSQKPEIASQSDFQTDMVLNQAYRKKNPGSKVNDDEINAYNTAHPKDFDDFLQANPRFQQQAQGPQRDEMKKQYGEFKVIADKARKDKLDQDDLTRLQLLFARSETLYGAYKTDLQKNADLVSDADVEAYYRDHPSDFDEIRVRHILVSTQPQPPSGDEDDADKGADKGKDKKKEEPKALTKDEARKKAQGLLERARKGEDFAKLAQENSDDPGSKSKGGEYDFFGKGRMVPEFEKAAFALKPGEISDLVETQFGIHIIKLEERRSAASPSADPKIKQQIVEKLKQEKLDDRVKQIADASPVVVPEDFDTTPKSASDSLVPSGVTVQPDAPKPERD